MNIKIVASALVIALGLAAPALVLAPIPAHAGLPDEDHEGRMYIVIVNSEGQLSIWVDYKEVPLGWTATGFTGTKAECVDYIRSHR